MNCPYCDSSEVSARKIAENQYARAFPTNIPITPGHVLVIPKRHVATFAELTADELLAIQELSENLKTALKTVFSAEGFNHAFNEGELAGQSIPHFHLHIVPRKKGDDGIYEYEPRKFLYRPGSREQTPEAELIEVASALRNAM